MFARSCRSALRAGHFRTNRFASSLVNVKHGEGGVATITLDRPPVNSLSLELLKDLDSALKSVEANRDVRGVVLGSSSANVFCAGLDITEMYQPDKMRLREFWTTLQEVWLTLYGSRLPIGAAINGHSPAGGCLLAMSADFRVMADGEAFKMGLNETQLGIVAPPWFKDTMLNTVGHRCTERMLALGLMVGPQQALQMGLVDQIVPQQEVAATTTTELQKWMRIPAEARIATKMLMRGDTLKRLRDNREADVDHFVSFLASESVQKNLGAYLESLKKKSKKK